MKTAVLICRLTGGHYVARQALYRLSEPLADEGLSYEFVVVSCANAPFSGPETYIFGANESGEIINWSELPGSFRGSLDPEAALFAAGYSIVKAA